MAVRLNRRHTESVVQKIQASQLLNRLQDHALENVEMSKTQIDAARFLLERVLARAEAPKNVHLSGNVTLSKLIEQAVTGADPTEEPDDE